MMPRTGRIFTAKGGTVFAWHADDPETDIEVTVPDSSLGLGDDKMTWTVEIPRADLDEFIAHIVSQAAEETLGRVLLFPCLQPPPPKSAA